MMCVIILELNTFTALSKNNFSSKMSIAYEGGFGNYIEVVFA